jgi:hypothetical protein
LFMRRVWLPILPLVLAGCATKPPLSAWDPRDAMFVWPEWTRTSVALLDLKENSGYTVSISKAGNTEPPPEPSTPVASKTTPPPPTPSPSPAPPPEAGETEYVRVGEKLRLKATAVSSLPLSYQWRKGGTPIPNETKAEYHIASVNESHAGSYDCLVSNSAGMRVSQKISLVVQKKD